MIRLLFLKKNKKRALFHKNELSLQFGEHLLCSYYLIGIEYV